MVQENLRKMIGNNDDEASYSESTAPVDSTHPDVPPQPPDETENPDADDIEGSGDSEISNYEVQNGHLFKIAGCKKVHVANFYLEILGEFIRKDESEVVGRDFKVLLHLNGKDVPFMISGKDFCSQRLVNRIFEHGGSGAIIYSNHTDLRIAAQEMSSPSVKTITTSMGFNEQGDYLAPGMIISSKGIDLSPPIQLDLGEGNFSRRIGFLQPDPHALVKLVQHLHDDFLQLKHHKVTYPLIAHLILASHASQIARIGKQKPVMHLQGPSGGGKTFLGILAACFYGRFEDQPMPWTSTANAIESEGYFFRDALMFIDDFKTPIVDEAKITRVIQNAANSQGRLRLGSGGNYKIQPMRGVRGLILSTGEDFVSDVESVLGRTVLIHVEPAQNHQAGANCWSRHSQYGILIPSLLQWLLSQDRWLEHLRSRIETLTQLLIGQVSGLSNGSRMAANWALNRLGFEIFIRFSRHMGVLNEQQGLDMISEYKGIVAQHIIGHAQRLHTNSPTEVFFQVLSEKLATGRAHITDLAGNNSGKNIGKLRDQQSIVCLYPDATLELMYSHFRSIGGRTPFSKERLRDALLTENLLIRSGPSRVTHQVRVDGSRLQAWQMDINEFKKRCGLSAS